VGRGWETGQAKGYPESDTILRGGERPVTKQRGLTAKQTRKKDVIYALDIEKELRCLICPLGHLQIESSKKKNRHCPQPLLKEELPLLVKASIPDAFMTYRLVILLLWNLCLVNP